MFNKHPYVMEIEKVTQQDMKIETINISVQAGTEDECKRMFNHVLSKR